MPDLYDLVERIESKTTDECLPILLTKPAELDLLLMNDQDKNGEKYYTLNLSLAGAQQNSRAATVTAMHEILRQTYKNHPATPVVDWSELRVTLRNGLEMNLEHHYVRPALLHHYVIDLYYPEDRKRAMVDITPLAELAKEVYGLHFNSRYKPYDNHLFPEHDDLKKGVRISAMSKLKHGTVFEQSAYQIMRQHRQQFSREEWKKLAAYDSALAEKKPITNHEQVMLLQEHRKAVITPASFLSGLRKLPAQVDSMSLAIHDQERFLCLFSKSPTGKKGKPYVTFFSGSEKTDERKYYLRTFLKTYAAWHNLTAKELEQLVVPGMVG